jgi:hypothetical protein
MHMESRQKPYGFLLWVCREAPLLWHREGASEHGVRLHGRCQLLLHVVLMYYYEIAGESVMHDFRCQEAEPEAGVGHITRASCLCGGNNAFYQNSKVVQDINFADFEKYTLLFIRSARLW